MAKLILTELLVYCQFVIILADKFFCAAQVHQVSLLRYTPLS
jgi:hypothetical protein